MRRKLLPFVLGGALSIAALGPVAAQPPIVLGPPTQAGLINVIVQAVVNDVEILDINDSLNNIARNVDIDVLNNALNNLNVEVTDVQVINGDVVVSLLGGGLIILR